MKRRREARNRIGKRRPARYPRAPEAEELPEPLPAIAVVSSEEQETRRRDWLAALDALAAQWDPLEKARLRLNEKALNRPACFQMRALACALAQIQTEAAGLFAPLEKP